MIGRFIFHGRFICDKCGQEHIGVMIAKQIREFLTMLLREKYSDSQSIIKKLEEKPISDTKVWLCRKMSDKYTGNHRYSLKEDEYIIANNSYLSSGILFPLITYLQKRIEEEKGGKQYQEYRNQLDTAKQILEKCEKGDKRISLTKDERSWLRRLLEDKRSSNDMWLNYITESKAFKLFSEGKSPIEVAIALDEPGDRVWYMYREYWELTWRYKLAQIYDEATSLD
jgi:hypothetical protein